MAVLVERFAAGRFVVALEAREAFFAGRLVAVFRFVAAIIWLLSFQCRSERNHRYSVAPHLTTEIARASTAPIPHRCLGTKAASAKEEAK